MRTFDLELAANPTQYKRTPLGLSCERLLSHRQKGALFYGKHEVYRDGCSQGRDLDRGSEFFRQAGDGKHHRNQGDYDS
jgi:hypothetical protein